MYVFSNYIVAYSYTLLLWLNSIAMMMMSTSENINVDDSHGWVAMFCNVYMGLSWSSNHEKDEK